MSHYILLVETNTAVRHWIKFVTYAEAELREKEYKKKGVMTEILRVDC